MYMEGKYVKLSNSNTFTTGDRALGLPSLMGNQAVLHNFYPVIQRMPEDALSYVPQEYRAGLSADSSWPEMEAVLVSAGAPHDYILEARRAYFRGMEDQLPTFEVNRLLWPNIAHHTEAYLDQGEEEGTTLTYMEERPLSPEDPYVQSQTASTNREKNRYQAQTKGQKLVPSRPGRDTQLDEFPYASTYEGGTDSSIMHVPRSENESHGGALGRFYSSSGLKDGYEFRVAVVDKKVNRRKKRK